MCTLEDLLNLSLALALAVVLMSQGWLFYRAFFISSHFCLSVVSIKVSRPFVFIVYLSREHKSVAHFAMGRSSRFLYCKGTNFLLSVLFRNYADAALL